MSRHFRDGHCQVQDIVEIQCFDALIRRALTASLTNGREYLILARLGAESRWIRYFPNVTV